ncbi:MAG: hypothetical protein KDK65_08010, partial [Chlamydiia bacterium]|nr:hypothetical protein [Chlamydiia bacterium]
TVGLQTERSEACGTAGAEKDAHFVPTLGQHVKECKVLGSTRNLFINKGTHFPDEPFFIVNCDPSS